MKISIITPNFNGGQFLEQTILSVLNQKYADLEYIVIDGGSTDNSLEIIKKYEKHLAYWVSEPDKGMYEAIQKGFDKSSGEVMAWLNSDDMYHPNALQSVAEIFESIGEVNWLVGASTYFDEKSRTVTCVQTRGFTRLDFLNADFKWIQQESVFWRRSLWEKSGSRLNTNLKYAGDFELWLRFFQHEPLNVTHALIGGFRLRSSNQFSLEHLDDYLEEVKVCLRNMEVSISDKKILSGYHRLKRIEALLQSLHVLNTARFSHKYRNKHFGSAPVIRFDRNKMKFSRF